MLKGDHISWRHNLREHLMNRHSGSYKGDGVKKKRSRELFNHLQGQSTVLRLEWRRSPNCIANFVAQDMRPMRVIEGQRFLKMLVYLEPGYKVPSWKHITSIIQQKHKLGTKHLQERLSDVTSLALTTDIWTSTATEAYITVTEHFIAPSWNFCSYVLEKAAFPDHYTGPAILLSSFTNFKVEPTKVVAIIHDQALNMELSLSILQEHHSTESICFSGHGLQLCLKAAISISAVDGLLWAVGESF